MPKIAEVLKRMAVSRAPRMTNDVARLIRTLEGIGEAALPTLKEVFELLKLNRPGYRSAFENEIARAIKTIEGKSTDADR